MLLFVYKVLFPAAENDPIDPNPLYSILIFHNAVEKEGDMKRLPVKKVVFK